MKSAQIEVWTVAVSTLTLFRQRLEARVTYFPHLLSAITACELLPLLAHDTDNPKAIRLIDMLENHKAVALGLDTAVLISEFLAEMDVLYKIHFDVGVA